MGSALSPGVGGGRELKESLAGKFQSLDPGNGRGIYSCETEKGPLHVTLIPWIQSSEANKIACPTPPPSRPVQRGKESVHDEGFFFLSSLYRIHLYH